MERKELSQPSNYSLSYLSRSRGPIMGLATLLVVCLHVYQIFGLDQASRLLSVKEILLDSSEYGVDLFILVFGFGLYCSLSQGIDLKSYLKRRIMRIYPEYLITMFILFLLIMKLPLKYVILQISGINL